MGVGLVDVDVIEQVLLHEVVVALRVVVRQAAVLIQVVRADLGEIKVAGLVGLDEVLIGPNGRGTGGQAENASGVHNDLRGDDVRRLTAHVLIVDGVNDTHEALLFSESSSRSMRASSAATNVRAHRPGRGRA